MGLRVGLDDPEGLFHPERFRDSDVTRPELRERLGLSLLSERGGDTPRVRRDQLDELLSPWRSSEKRWKDSFLGVRKGGAAP